MENCEFVRLGDIVNIKTGKLDANASSPDGKYPFFTCAKEPLRINSYSYDCECVLVAGNGDLNVKYFHGKFDAYQRTYIIERKNDNLYMPYLYYFLDNYIEILRKKSIGGIIKYIKLNNLTDIKFPLPEKQKQIEISNILSKSKATINNLKTRIQKYDELVKSQFIEMFGTSEYAWKYQTTKLENLASFKTGGTPDRKKMDQYVGTIPWITTISLGESYIDSSNAVNYISQKAINESSTHLIPENSLMLGIRVGVGKCSINKEPICTNQDIVSLYNIKKEINPLFLKKVIDDCEKQFNENKRGATIKGVTTGFVKNLDIPTPPIELQNQFADFVKHIDKLKFRKNITKLRNICYNIFSFEKFNMQREVKNG